MNKGLFAAIDCTDRIYIAMKNNDVTAYIVAPAEWSYDDECDALILGDDESGLTIRNFSDYMIDKDDEYFEFSMVRGSCEIIISL